MRAGLELPAEHSELHFPMTHDAEILARYWLDAAQTVLAILQRGEDVLFLVEGDASTIPLSAICNAVFVPYSRKLQSK